MTLSCRFPIPVHRVRITREVGLAAALLTLAPAPARSQQGPTTPNQVGAGCAVIDYDRDGDLDLFYVETGDGRVLVYRNELIPGGALAFVDVSTAVMPASVASANGMGVARGDVNNDGFDDILVTYAASRANLSAPYRLFLNQQGERFTEATRSAGLTSYESGTISSSAAFFDYDRDGDLDLYIGAYLTFRTGAGGLMENGNAKKTFYENMGNQPNGIPTFVDRTDEKGIGWCGGQSEWTLGLATGDYDNDGDMDLYLANDYGGCNSDGSIRAGDNCMFRNNGDGSFTNVTSESNTRDGGYAMGVDFGDYDNDGNLDLFVTNFWYDSLLRNKGDGTFADVSLATGINEALNGWAATFCDYDNDGQLDIMNVNGWILNSWGQVECEPNCVWRNEGPDAPVRFRERGAEVGIQVFGDARGAAWGDIDQDGWVDMIVANNTDWDHSGAECDFNAPRRLVFVNRGDGTFIDVSNPTGVRSDPTTLPTAASRTPLTHHWLTVVPHCVTSNRSAIGTRVTLRVGERTYLRELGCGSYLSSNEAALHFGLGAADRIDELTIRWPNGNVEHLTDVAVDQRLHATEGQVETPITLTSFTAAQADGELVVQWSFADARDHAGFHLHRRPAATGEFVRITDRILAGDQSPITYRDAGVTPGRYEYRLESIDRDGTSRWHGPITAELTPPAGGPRVGQNYPNPFNPVTTIPVVIGAAGSPAGRPLEVWIHGADGALVRRLPVPTMAPGTIRLVWDGLDERGQAAPSGHYYYRIGGEAGPSRRMLLVK